MMNVALQQELVLLKRTSTPFNFVGSLMTMFAGGFPLLQKGCSNEWFSKCQKSMFEIAFSVSITGLQMRPRNRLGVGFFAC
jgi:hypothetical protein